MRIFISHIHEEADIALILKKWIESTFLGQWDVFVSSDTDDIPAGKKWLQEIDAALEESKLMIVLCSSYSISRPWINFEAGCGWIKKIPLIPICYLGMHKNELPAPLSMFQAINLEDKNFPDLLLRSIAKHLKVNRIPNIDKMEFKKNISKAISAIKEKERPEVINNPITNDNFSELGEIEVKILICLEEFSDKRPSAKIIANELNIPIEKAKYYLYEMAKSRLIKPYAIIGSPTTYELDQLGRKYLIDNGHL